MLRAILTAFTRAGGAAAGYQWQREWVASLAHCVSASATDRLGADFLRKTYGRMSVAASLLQRSRRVALVTRRVRAALGWCVFDSSAAATYTKIKETPLNRCGCNITKRRPGLV